MGKELSIDTQQDLIDVLTERPISFRVNGKRYTMYQPTLGKVLLIQKELADRKLNFSDIPTLCTKERALCCKLVALSCLYNRKQLFNEVLVKTITDELDYALDLEGLSKLIYLIKRFNDTDELAKAIGLHEDDDTRVKISRMKSQKDSSLVLGGHSIYGTLIDAACQRYGWKVEYLLWEVSYANVHFMMKDAISPVYLSEEDRKKLHVKSGEMIDAGDPKNNDIIAKMLKD